MDPEYEESKENLAADVAGAENVYPFFQDILANSQGILYRYNFNTRTYDYLSHSIESLTGYSAEHIMAAGIDFLSDTLHPDDKDPFNKIYKGLLNGTITDTSLQLEYRTRHKDGQYRWNRDHVRILRDADGRIGAIAGDVCDITDLKQREQALLASQERFKRLSEVAFEAILIHEEGKALDANQQCLNLTGYTMDELKTINGMTAIAPQSRDLVKEKIASGFEGVYEAFGLKKDGTIFPAEVRTKNVIFDGKSVRIVALRDLTAQQQTRQQLEESERKYRKLYLDAPVALFRTALDGTLLDCNKACVKLFGYPVDEEEANYLNKFCVADTYVSPNRRMDFIAALQKKGQVCRFEAELKRPDGTVFWASIAAELLPEAGCIEGAMYNITLKKILSKAELKILRILMQGKSNKETARELGRSIRTVEDHRAHLMHKLGVDNVFDLAKKAMELGFDSRAE